MHGGAVLIRTQAELNDLVLGPNAGRTLWVLWRSDMLRDARSATIKLLASLDPRVVSRRRTPDGHVVLKVQL